MAVLIGLSSRKGGGKSSLADALERHSSDLWPHWEGNTRIATPVLRLPMAAPIKEIAVDLLEIPAELVYGDDDAKNNFTRYCWSDMPHYERLINRHGAYHYPPHLPMTVRDILQQLGTEIFRAIFPSVFINRWRRTARKWVESNPLGVVIAEDVRFGNEIDGLLEEDAYLFRLLRGVRGDKHESEQDLDDHPGFPCVIDNREMSKWEVAEEAVKALRFVGLVKERDAIVTSVRLLELGGF